MAKLADAPDLKSGAPQGACGFDSHPWHSSAKFGSNNRREYAFSMAFIIPILLTVAVLLAVPQAVIAAAIVAAMAGASAAITKLLFRRA